MKAASIKINSTSVLQKHSTKTKNLLFTIPGPIEVEYDYSKAVDFSSTLYMDHYSIMVPLKPMKKLWSFLGPLDSRVWITFLLIIPTFIFTMGLANYMYYKKINWRPLIDFVLRTAMVDNTDIRSYGFEKTFQKILASFWIWAMFLLTAAYSGNLLAEVTKPSFQTPIKTVEDLVNQDFFTWESGSLSYAIADYLQGSPPGSIHRRLYDQGETTNSYVDYDYVDYDDNEYDSWTCCISTTQRYDGKTAAICDSKCISDTKHKDFGESGMCNYYSIGETFFTSSAAMVLQRKSPFLNDVNYLLNLASQMGLIEGLYEKVRQNATKCNAWNDILATHKRTEGSLIIVMNDIKGILALLTIGLCISIIAFIVEVLRPKSKKKKNSGRNSAIPK